MATVYFSVALIVHDRHGCAVRARSPLRVGAAAHRQLGPVLRDHQLRHVAVQRHLSAHTAPGSRPATSPRSRSSRTRSPATCSTRAAVRRLRARRACSLPRLQGRGAAARLTPLGCNFRRSPCRGAAQLAAAGRKPAANPRKNHDEVRYPPRLSHDQRRNDRRHQVPDPLDLGQGRRHAPPRHRSEGASGMDRRQPAAAPGRRPGRALQQALRRSHASARNDSGCHPGCPAEAFAAPRIETERLVLRALAQGRLSAVSCDPAASRGASSLRAEPDDRRGLLAPAARRPSASGSSTASAPGRSSARPTAS